MLPLKAPTKSSVCAPPVFKGTALNMLRLVMKGVMAGVDTLETDSVLIAKLLLWAGK